MENRRGVSILKSNTWALMLRMVSCQPCGAVVSNPHSVADAVLRSKFQRRVMLNPRKSADHAIIGPNMLGYQSVLSPVNSHCVPIILAYISIYIYMVSPPPRPTLGIFVYIYLCVCTCTIYLFVYLFVCLSVCLSIYRSIYLPIDISTDRSISPSIYLSIHPFYLFSHDIPLNLHDVSVKSPLYFQHITVFICFFTVTIILL